jgi:hypothetical protein
MMRKFEPEDLTSKTDLRFGATESPNGIHFLVTYATSLFKKSTARKMAEYYLEILNQVLENDDIKLADIMISHDLLTVRASDLRSEEKEFGF